MKTVFYNGEPVGTLDWQSKGRGAQVDVSCSMPNTTGFLRCWAKTKSGWFLIGLLAPEGGKLALQRTLSGETCKQMGAVNEVPTEFVLSESRPSQETTVPSAAVGDSVAQAQLETPVIAQPEAPVPDIPEPDIQTPKNPARDIPDPEIPRPNVPDPNQTPPEIPVPQPREMPQMPGPEIMAEAEEKPCVETVQVPSRMQEKPALPQTGDPLLDSLLSDDALGITYKQNANTIVFTCAFAADKPFALAPLFGLCTVEDGKAVLRWKKQCAEH